ncbi:MAG: AAA family ATPase [Methylocystis sp.]|uniref:AAA family ATPase n=1 Tax=Methylocystis sp. TaxID=1911079 RepID=UPI003D0A1B5D
MTTADSTAFVYYRALRLANVKSFIPGTTLDLCIDGRPAPWTLILGENGLGKTTLLQCLALLRPTLNVKQSEDTDARTPDRIEPALPEYEDDLLRDLARVGEQLQIELSADFEIGWSLRSGARSTHKRQQTTTWAKYTAHERDFSDFTFSKVQRPDFRAPLFVAYSAARHAPYRRTDVVSDQEDSTASLFKPEIELIDAVKVLEDLDHISLREKHDERGTQRRRGVSIAKGEASSLYDSIREALATILPEVEKPERIKVYGPALPGRDNKKTGVWIETYSGEVPLRSLSIGYQTMFAWTVDLAWRLAEHHKDSRAPLHEAAIVLIDELDLHLHPKWQRRVRRDLSAVFPQVQFIVTTHSPVLAQTYLDTNIAVVRRDGDHATIDNDPRVVRSWRLDQVSESLLHDLNPYSPELIEAFQTRSTLLAKKRLTPSDRAKLDAANALVANVDSDSNPDDQAAAKLIREAAQLIATRPK